MHAISFTHTHTLHITAPQFFLHSLWRVDEAQRMQQIHNVIPGVVRAEHTAKWCLEWRVTGHFARNDTRFFSPPLCLRCSVYLCVSGWIEKVTDWVEIISAETGAQESVWCSRKSRKEEKKILQSGAISLVELWWMGGCNRRVCPGNHRSPTVI